MAAHTPDLAATRKARLRRRQVLLTVPLCLVIGALSGVVFQKFYGAGRLLNELGLRASTAATSGPGELSSISEGLPEETYGSLSLFILAGQSNMSGRGALPATQDVPDNVYTFGNDYRWIRAREPVDDPAGQIDSVSTDGPGDPAGFGPALSFARALAVERPDMAIGLIPCAKGNSSIHEWRRSLSDATLYGSCLKRTRAASPAGRVSGLLFFQGESDALTPERNPGRILSSATYATLFTEVVNGLRRDVSSPRLPIVFAQIGSQRAPLVFANWTVVQEQQAAVHLPCGVMIETRDLPLGDDVHFTTPGYEAIGRRFADAYLSLMARESQCRV